MLNCIAVSIPEGSDSAGQSSEIVLYAATAADEAALTACAAEVRVLYQGAWANIIKIGGVLKQAKEKCAYGTWGKWIENECGFSQKTATRYMQVFDRFSENEKVLALPGSLSYALLGVPDEEEVNELAELAAEEGWSERQLKQEIARRKQAEKEAEKAKLEAEQAAQELERAVAAAQEIEDDLEREKADLAEEAKAANRRADAFSENLTDANQEMQRLRMELAAARRAEAEPRIVEKRVEVYPVDYDAAKERAEHLERVREVQQNTIDRLKNELEAARSTTSKAMSAEQFGDAITIFFSRTADIARQPFDDMPAGVVGAFLDQVGRIERFCADLRAVMSGD